MTDTTPRAGAPLLAANQAQKNVTHNEALYQFDALMSARFLDCDLTTPPSSPADGDTYLVNATATGAWTGQDGKIAYCADGGWRFYAPFAGLVAYVVDANNIIAFNGTAWVNLATLITLENSPMLGVNTTADATNKLAVQSNAALFTGLPTGSGGSGDIRVTLSKQAAANTASFLFQDNFSGRAEIGLVGDDNFHFKVSPDGSSWTDALDIAAATGVVTVASAIFTMADINGGTIDNVAIGNTTPPTARLNSLAVLSGGTVLTVGADSGAATLTDSTQKTSRVGTPHYLNAQAPATVFEMVTDVSTNTLRIGGGTSSMNAATSVVFLAAANSTTPTGTTMGTVSSSGWVLSPANASVALSPTGTGAVTISPAAGLTINPTTAGTINNASIGVTTAAAGRFTTLQATTSLKLPTTANGAVATTMTSLGPTGSHTTVQEWFAVQNASGVTRYIPAY